MAFEPAIARNTKPVAITITSNKTKFLKTIVYEMFNTMYTIPIKPTELLMVKPIKIPMAQSAIAEM